MGGGEDGKVSYRLSLPVLETWGCILGLLS